MRRTAMLGLAAVLVLGGCSGGDDPATEPAPTSAEPTTEPEPTGEPAPEPSEDASPSAAPAPDAAWPAATTALEHGGQLWATYVATAATQDDPAITAAQTRLAEVGYPTSGFAGDLACDQGAAEALGVTDAYGVGVYFDTQEDAELFAELWGPDAVGTAQITVYCAD